MIELSYVVTPLEQKIKGLRTLVLNTNKQLNAAIRLITAFLQRIAVHLFIELIVIEFEVSESLSLDGPFELFEDVVLGSQFPALRLLEMCVATRNTGYREKELIKLFPRVSEHRKLEVKFRSMV